MLFYWFKKISSVWWNRQLHGVDVTCIISMCINRYLKSLLRLIRHKARSIKRGYPSLTAFPCSVIKRVSFSSSVSLTYLFNFVVLFNTTTNIIIIIRTTNFSVVRYSHATEFIERHGGHFTRTPSAVLVVSVISGARVVVVVIYIPTGRFVLRNHMNYPCQCQCNIMLFMSEDEHDVLLYLYNINNACNIFNSARFPTEGTMTRDGCWKQRTQKTHARRTYNMCRSE